MREGVINMGEKLVSERMRGKDVKFERVRRVTGYITGDIDTWNDAKKRECMERLAHKY